MIFKHFLVIYKKLCLNLSASITNSDECQWPLLFYVKYVPYYIKKKHSYAYRICLRNKSVLLLPKYLIFRMFVIFAK